MRPVLFFLAGFLLIYGLLIAPWPGWNEIYGDYFRLIGGAAFSRDDGQRIVRFEYHPIRHDFSELNTRMTLGNRDLADSSGKGPGILVDLDTRSIGWVPTALTIALILATPIPWPRRARALLWGLLGIHLFILFSLQVWIWDKSPDLSLSAPPDFVKEIFGELDYALLTQLGASFSVPVVLWILLTFRREDLSRLFLK